MSVLIKGMEMPTSCDKCIYSAWSNFYQIYVCNAVRKNEPVLFDGKQTKSTACARSARADNCPLVPVPPHGRLIEDVAVREQIDEWLDSVGDVVVGRGLSYYGELLGCIEDAPTIIEAEEGE